MKKFGNRLSYSDLYLKLHARAEWTAKVEDDVFSGAKQAMLAGSVSQMIGIVFDCTKDSLSMAYIGKGPLNAQEPVPVTIIVKFDGNEPVKFEGAFTKRNDEYIQASRDQEGIV